MRKPQTINEYKTWLKSELGFRISGADRQYYYSVAKAMRGQFLASDFWCDLSSTLERFSGQYLSRTGYQLLASLDLPPILVKPFNSFLLKTYRKNVVNNMRWSDQMSPPSGGWITPENWFSEINDIIRTLFVVRYLDGVEFLAESIEELASQHGVSCTVSYEAKETGYYAAHLDIMLDCEIPDRYWGTARVLSPIEFQITTQVQELIRRLLHKRYEIERKSQPSTSVKGWQWDYNNQQFTLNYMGHLLHYVEGMIMQLRDA